MIQSNVDYFKYVNTEAGNKILAQLTSMQQLLQWIETSATRITSTAHLYDLDSETPANGFRSFITVVDRFILLATKLCRTICMKRDSIFFRSESCLKELEDHVGILHGLKIGMALLERMMENTDHGSLFVSMEFNELFNECDRFDPTSFYGRSMGFYVSSVFCLSTLLYHWHADYLVVVSVSYCRFSPDYKPKVQATRTVFLHRT